MIPADTGSARLRMVREWGDLALRYRWFVGFGAAWFAIVLVVSPVGPLTGGQAPVQYSSPAGGDVRGTLGSVSTPRSPQAGAIEAITGFTDAFPSAGLEPGYGGFEPSEGQQDAGDSGGGGAGDDSTGEETTPEPGPCTVDEQLPAPVATTIVGSVGGLEDQVGGATGQAPPTDASGTAGGALGCGGTQGTTPPAPSLSNNVVVGGFSGLDLLYLIMGLGVPRR